MNADPMREYKAIKQSWRAGDSSHRFTLIPCGNIHLPTGRTYLVKGMIPRQGLIVAWGPPKCGKSFWAFDVAMHIALGREYRGCRVQQGPVVYIAAEGASGQGARVAAWRTKNAADQVVPLSLLPDRPDLTADAERLIADIREQIPEALPALVVVDTLNRTIAGSESLDEDMTRYIQAADKIKDAFGCAVLVIHHCGVEGTRPRGHTSLTGAADAQISVKRDAAGKIVTMVEWAKDFAEGAETVSTLEVVEVGTDEDGDPITSCVVVPSDDAAIAADRTKRLPPATAIALTALMEAIADGGQIPPTSNHIPANVSVVSVELWRRYAYAKDTEANPQAKKKAFQRATKTLLANGMVGTWNDQAWTVAQ
jgi:hypothetical protein